MRNFSVTCFGVGDGWPCPDRHHASFLYRLGGSSLLVDCGEPVDSRLEASGIRRESLDGILLSHAHADHIGGFLMLAQGMWLGGRRRTLPVFLPRGLIQPFRAMLRASLLFDDLVKFRWNFEPWRAGRTTRVGSVSITPFPTTHLDDLRERFGRKYRADFSAFSFLLETQGRRIGHSADLGRPEDLAPLVQQPLDLLICEMSHFPPRQILSYLRGRPIRRVVFVHLSRAAWNNLTATKRLAKKLLLKIPHTFARDGEVIDI
jgi:hypothetical protein